MSRSAEQYTHRSHRLFNTNSPLSRFEPRPLSLQAGFFIKAARLALQLGRRGRFDLAIACSMPDLAILSALPCRLAGAELILDVHDTMPELYNDNFGGTRGALGARLLMLEERLSAALADRVLADRVLAVHEPHAERLALAGIRPEKIRIVTNLPDAAIFRKSVAQTSPSRPFTVVCHGTVAKRLGLEVATKVAVLNRGRIEQAGTPEELYHHPATPFVSGFLGNVNLFHGRIENGQVYLHGTPLLLKATTRPNGSAEQAVIYIRPHALDIEIKSNGHSGLPARVQRINTAGPHVKVELVSDWGDPILVEMGHERLQLLGLATDTRVYLRPRNEEVFVYDAP